MKLINKIKHPNGLIEKHFDDGTISFYKNEEIHNDNGPAVKFSDGTKKWLINGRYHREDGPAIEWASGIKEWYLNDKLLSEQEFNAIQLNKKLQDELPSNQEANKKLKI